MRTSKNPLNKGITFFDRVNYPLHIKSIIALLYENKLLKKNKNT